MIKLKEKILAISFQILKHFKIQFKYLQVLKELVHRIKIQNRVA